MDSMSHIPVSSCRIYLGVVGGVRSILLLIIIIYPINHYKKDLRNNQITFVRYVHTINNHICEIKKGVSNRSSNQIFCILYMKK